MSNDKKALIALMDLVLALADYATTPPGHREKATERVQERATRLRALGALCEDGQAARTAVAATERRYDRIGVRPSRWQLMQELKDLAGNPLDPHFGLEAYEGLEADDSRVTDHTCCGGKPDCGCARSVGG